MLPPRRWVWALGGLCGVNVHVKVAEAGKPPLGASDVRSTYRSGMDPFIHASTSSLEVYCNRVSYLRSPNCQCPHCILTTNGERDTGGTLDYLVENTELMLGFLTYQQLEN